MRSVYVYAGLHKPSEAHPLISHHHLLMPLTLPHRWWQAHTAGGVPGRRRGLPAWHEHQRLLTVDFAPEEELDRRRKLKADGEGAVGGEEKCAARCGGEDRKK